MKKSILKSKTFWANLIMASMPLFPSMGKVVGSNLEIFTMAWGLMAVVLRMVTKDKVILLDK